MRRSSHPSIFLVAVLCLSLALFVIPLGTAHAESLGPWTQTTNYPIQVAADSCVSYSDYVYCVGGFDSSDNSYSNVYYAPLSSSGIGSWSTGTQYPTAVDSASCVTSTTYIYCVGGENGQSSQSSATVLNNVYYAPLSTPGLGSWSNAAAYPTAVAAPSCVVYSGYIYCVGGFDSDGDELSSTYYAALSSGLNSWTSTTSYPVAADSQSCVVYLGDIYCVAGETESGQNQNNPINEVYYAPLSSSGIGSWSASPVYPTPLAALSCVASSGYIYCVGGFDINQLSNSSAYYGALSPSGIASWTSTTPYPSAVDTSSCVTDTSYVYCVAGVSDTSSSSSMLSSAYYALAPGSATSTSSTVPEFPGAVAIPLTLAATLLGAAFLGLGARKKR